MTPSTPQVFRSGKRAVALEFHALRAVANGLANVTRALFGLPIKLWEIRVLAFVVIDRMRWRSAHASLKAARISLEAFLRGLGR